MTNSNNKTNQISSLQNEGSALTKAFKSQERAFAKSIKAEGFDYRLGTLIKQIKQIENVTVLSKQLKKKYNISSIDRRRTSEAEWLIDNSQSVADFVKKSKFKGTSINSLQNAMRKASKDATTSAKADKTTTDAKASTQSAKADTTVSKETETTDDKSSEVSHIGQFQVSNKKLTADDIALEMLVQADVHQVPHKELINALIEQIKMLTTEEVA